MTTVFKLFSDSSASRDYEDGETIYDAGDKADEMFIVLSGKVDILVNDTIFESIDPGCVVGEVALLDRGVHAAHAVARGNCKLEPLNRKRFEFLVQQTPFFAMDIMRAMAERMHKRISD